jgi:hypothetical protein
MKSTHFVCCRGVGASRSRTAAKRRISVGSEANRAPSQLAPQTPQRVQRVAVASPAEKTRGSAEAPAYRRRGFARNWTEHHLQLQFPSPILPWLPRVAYLTLKLFFFSFPFFSVNLNSFFPTSLIALCILASQSQDRLRIRDAGRSSFLQPRVQAMPAGGSSRYCRLDSRCMAPQIHRVAAPWTHANPSANVSRDTDTTRASMSE